MSQVLILLRKSILNFRRARAAIVITFLVPIVLIYLFGHVFGLYRKDSGPPPITVAVVNESPDAAARQLVDALKGEKGLDIRTDKNAADGSRHALTETDVRQALKDNDYRYAVVLPADLLSDDRMGVRIKFLSNPRNEIEAQTVNGLLQKTIFAKVPKLLGQSLQRRAKHFLGDGRYSEFNHGLASTISTAFGGDSAEVEQRIRDGDFFANSLGTAGTPPTATNGASTPANATANAAGKSEEADRSSDAFSSMVKIESEQVEGKEVKNPMAARIVGGYAIMFLLFAVTAGASSMFEEKATGIFHRLLSSPVTPAHILWARFLFGGLLGLVQITALFLAGRMFFQLEIFSHLGALILVTVAAAAACSAFGILVAAISPSAEAARGIATFLVITMSAVGGAWVPVSWMPAYIQMISKGTIVYWSIEGFTDVLWAGHSLVQVLPKVGILAAIAAVVMAVSIWLFNRSRFFEG